MNIIINTIIFLIVLFFYLHIVFHLKKSNDLEIFEIDNPSKDELEEICDLRQPLIFNDTNNPENNPENNISKIIATINKASILDEYGAFDIKIRNTRDRDDETDLYLSLVLNKAIHLADKDTEQKYISENNMDFLEETSLLKNITYNDGFLRPSMTASNIYDIMFGSEGSYTPFQYKLSYRNYFLITEGEVKIRLAPPKSIKYLNLDIDYENFEFKSLIDVWNVQDKYKNDFDKIKCLDIQVKKGQIVYIPAYWFYSIKYGRDSCICNFQYKPYMNILAIAPHLFLRFLQNNNIKRNSIELAANVKKGINPDKEAKIEKVTENTENNSPPDISNNINTISNISNISNTNNKLDL